MCLKYERIRKIRDFGGCVGGIGGMEKSEELEGGSEVPGVKKSEMSEGVSEVSEGRKNWRCGQNCQRFQFTG